MVSVEDRAVAFGPETPADVLVAESAALVVTMWMGGGVLVQMTRKVYPAAGSGLTAGELLRLCLEDERFRSVDVESGVLTRRDDDGRTVLLAEYGGELSNEGGEWMEVEGAAVADLFQPWTPLPLPADLTR